MTKKPKKQIDSNKQKYIFTVRDLVIIAVLCSLGGVMSTYVKYIAHLINTAFGVPFGAAQLVAGLHVLWLVLCFGLVRKLGTGTIAGFLKGVVELFSGNPHGITVVMISGIEGIFLDMGMAVFRKKHAVYSYGISAGFAAAAEVFVFYPLFFPAMPVWFVIATSSIAFGSGLVFGGFFGTGTLELLHHAKVAKIPHWTPSNLIPITSNDKTSKNKSNNRFYKFRHKPYYVATIVFIIFFSIGGIAYYLTVPSLFEDASSCEVEGAVDNPYTYKPNDFKDEKITITAKLEGQVTVEPEKEYTGVPLYKIIAHSQPNANATEIEVIGSDGYSVPFSWNEIKNDDRLILIQDEDTLRLIAGDYDGSYWVRMVVRIVVK